MTVFEAVVYMMETGKPVIISGSFIPKWLQKLGLKKCKRVCPSKSYYKICHCDTIVYLVPATISSAYVEEVMPVKEFLRRMESFCFVIYTE